MKAELKEEQQQLSTQVGALIADVERTHRYSMSRIYGLYNQVFDKTEKAQSCASCLIRKVRALKTWLEIQKAVETSVAKPKARKGKRKPKADEIQ